MRRFFENPDEDCDGLNEKLQKGDDQIAAAARSLAVLDQFHGRLGR